MPGGYDLGTARGRIEIDSSGAVRSYATAAKAHQGFVGRLSNAQSALRTTGKAMIGLGAAALAGVGVAVKASADFEKEISKFQAAAQETEPVLEAVRQKALQIGRDTSFGAGQAAEAITALSYAGLSTEEILDGAADAAVALAEAGELEIPQAASIMSASMNSFGLAAEDAMQVADSMIGVFANSDTMVDELGEALKNVSATASTAGVSLQDTTVAIGLLADKGIKGGRAGTTLNRMLLSLQPSSDKAKEAMEELGIITEEGANRFFDAEGNMQNLSEVSQVLQDSLKGLTKQQKLAALETIFGSRALSAAGALAEAGAEGFDELYNEMGDVQAADVAKEKLNNLSGALTILKGTIETALIGAGAPLQDVLKGIVQGITSLINRFAQLPPSVQKFITVGALVGGLLSVIGGAMLLVLARVPAMIAGFKSLTALFGGVAGKGGLVKGVLAGVKAAIFGVGNALKALFIGSPVGWLLLLAGALYLLYQRSETVRNAVRWVLDQFKTLGSFIGAVLSRDIQGIKEGFEKLEGPFLAIGMAAKAVINELRSVWRVISEGKVFEDASGFVRGFAEVWQGVTSALGNFLSQAKLVASVIAGVLTGNVDSTILSMGRMGDTAHRIAGIFVVAFYHIKNTVVTVLAFLLGLWRSHGDTVLAIIRNTFNFIVGVVRTALPILIGIVRTAFNIIKTVIMTVLNVVKGIISTFVNLVLAFWRRFGNTIKVFTKNIFGAMQKIIRGILNIITGIVKAFIALFKGDWRGLGRALQQIWRGFLQVIQGALRGAVAIILGIISGLVNAAIGLWNTLKDRTISLFRSAKDGAVSAFRSMKDLAIRSVRNLKDGAIELGRAVMDWFRELPGRITSTFTNLPGQMLEIGKSILRGLKDGIVSAGGEAVQAAKDVAANVASQVTGFFGISSPSRLMMRYGRSIAEGLRVGIQAGARQVNSVLNEMIRAVRQGKGFFEDFSFRGMSDAAEEMKDQIAEAFYSSHPGVDFGSLSRRELAQALRGMKVQAPRRRGAPSNARFRGRTVNREGDIIINNLSLPNIDRHSDAEDLLEGLRQAARQRVGSR